MTRFLLCILCLLSFLCAETQAKAYWHYETAEKDRDQARLKLESMQNSSPAAGEVRIMKIAFPGLCHAVRRGADLHADYCFVS